MEPVYLLSPDKGGMSGFALGPRVAIVEVGDVCVTIRLWSVLSHCSQRVVVVYSTFSRTSSRTG